MKKKLDKLKSIFIIDKQIIIFLVGLSLIAIVAGSFYITTLNKTDNSLLEKALANFFNNVKINKLNYGLSLKNTFFVNMGFIILTWLLGISVIGIPLIIFLFFSKTFTLGVSISSIIYNYKLKGFFLSFLYIFPHYIINTYIYIILISYSFSLSLKIIDSALKRKSIDFKIVMNKYLYVLFISFVVISLTSLFEVFLTPFLMRFLLTLTK